MTKMIPPVAITDTELLATNIAATAHPEWDISTTYAALDKVYVEGVAGKAFQIIYESQVGSNLGNDPATDDGTKWVEIGATDRYKPFDRKISDTVSNSGAITYSIVPATRVTGAGFLGLTAAEVRVQVYDNSSPAVEIFDQTRSLVDTTPVVDWYSFFTWDAEEYDTEAIFDGIPAYAGYQIDITIGDGAGTAAVGQIILGNVITLGAALDGTTVGIRDFSVKDRDIYGNAVITERAFADETTFNFMLPTGDARRVKRILAAQRAAPALYYADAETPQFGATVFGFYQDFDIPLSASGTSFANLTIEGLT